MLFRNVSKLSEAEALVKRQTDRQTNEAVPSCAQDHQQRRLRLFAGLSAVSSWRRKECVESLNNWAARTQHAFEHLVLSDSVF